MVEVENWYFSTSISLKLLGLNLNNKQPLEIKNVYTLILIFNFVILVSAYLYLQAGGRRGRMRVNKTYINSSFVSS